MKTSFATSNEHKFKEARAILSSHEITLEHFAFDHTEIRSDSLEEIALEALGHAYEKANGPVFVEDGGLFVDALNGFPGTFSGWALKKIGSEGILKLLDCEKNRAASFHACIAYTDGKITKTFFAEAKGAIALDKRGVSGFGYDPIFIPQGYKKTFAEAPKIKEMVSHRHKALMGLANFLKNQK